MERLYCNIGVLIFGALTATGAPGQAFPSKPIRLLVSFPSGGATDTFSRTIAAEMTKSLGQQVIVENRPGAGTTIAAGLVAKAPPDGYTLLSTELLTHAVTASLYTTLPYHPSRDFAAVAPVNSLPMLMVAHPSVGVKTVRELVALAKRHPGITLGNSGAGTLTHMAAEMFRMRAGIEVTAVPYKGGNSQVNALLGGEVATVVATIPATLPHVRAGKLVALGVTSERRSSYLPDIPAIGETVKGVDATTIIAVLAPAGTPRDVIDRLNAEVAKAVDSPKSGEIFAANAAERMKTSPAALQQTLEAGIKTWAEVVKATGVKVE